ncbi:Lrp/AsnC family transcriptional regulator [Pseudomonas brenneri]|uniref:Lrp/AsnC family transcriptional regulator n=1 Tax=Pseudomonas brenneri TaxID=129817 RepID=UPI0028D05C18|nr:Lrp/AsnC family transcriptional regulator [Pseudomonas brenneri]
MSEMLLSVLLSKAKGISPEAKYVLVRLVECGLVAGPICSGVKELAGRFGISDSQMGVALNSLTAAKVLVRRDLVSGQGRPKRQYELAPGDVEQVGLNDVSKVVHARVIHHLLKHESKALQLSDVAMQQKGPLEGAPLAHVRASRKQGRLSVVNRLLLAVLLCRADRFGVVRDLGRAELSRLTGLSQERLKNRIRTLLDSGLIRAYTPGATGSVIFKKTKSVYYLNLHHPELSCGQSLPMLLVSVTQNLTSANERDVVDGMLWSPQGEREQCSIGVRRFFKNRHEQELACFLRGRLDWYAGYLLSHHWGLLGDGEAELDQLIKLDLLDASDKESCQPLVTYLIERVEYMASRASAGWIDGKLTLIPGVDFKTLDYVLLPMQKTAGLYPSRAMLALSKMGGTCSKALHIVGFQDDEEGKVQCVADSEALSREKQYLYSLLTPA